MKWNTCCTRARCLRREWHPCDNKQLDQCCQKRTESQPKISELKQDMVPRI